MVIEPLLWAITTSLACAALELEAMEHRAVRLGPTSAPRDFAPHIV